MQIDFAGTRGSMPVCSPDRHEFGGDTTCVLVRGQGGEQVLIDAGTGLRHVAARLAPLRPVHLLLTHFHLDHLVGLPTWDSLYARGREVMIAAPRTDGATVSEAVGGLVGSPYWPVPLEALMSRITFVDLGERSGDRPLRLGGFQVSWTPLPHPGGCTAYRIDEAASGASVVMATDCEWESAPADLRQEFVGFAAGCGLLICDGQYEPGEMADRNGWGHTSWRGAAALAREVGCGRLVLTHHDPLVDDATLAARERDLQADLAGAMLARQGTTVQLPGKDPA
ncbi:MAG: MBL fold metallo-hydrolase [Candidatus Krumholzibacteriia bacterium]